MLRSIRPVAFAGVCVAVIVCGFVRGDSPFPSDGDSPDRRPTAEEIDRLISDLRLQINLAYRRNIQERDLRLRQTAAAIRLWRDAPQSATNQQRFRDWLRKSIRQSMPGATGGFLSLPQWDSPRNQEVARSESDTTKESPSPADLTNLMESNRGAPVANQPTLSSDTEPTFTADSADNPFWDQEPTPAPRSSNPFLDDEPESKLVAPVSPHHRPHEDTSIVVNQSPPHAGVPEKKQVQSPRVPESPREKTIVENPIFTRPPQPSSRVTKVQTESIEPATPKTKPRRRTAGRELGPTAGQARAVATTKRPVAVNLRELNARVAGYDHRLRTVRADVLDLKSLTTEDLAHVTIELEELARAREFIDLYIDNLNANQRKRMLVPSKSVYLVNLVERELKRRHKKLENQRRDAEADDDYRLLTTALDTMRRMNRSREE